MPDGAVHVAGLDAASHHVVEQVALPSLPASPPVVLTAESPAPTQAFPPQTTADELIAGEYSDCPSPTRQCPPIDEVIPAGWAAHP